MLFQLSTIFNTLLSRTLDLLSVLHSDRGTSTIWSLFLVLLLLHVVFWQLLWARCVVFSGAAHLGGGGWRMRPTVCWVGSLCYQQCHTDSTRNFCHLGSESLFSQIVVANGKEKGLPRWDWSQDLLQVRNSKGQLVQRKTVFPPLHVPFPFLIRLEEVIVRTRPAWLEQCI